MANKIKQLRFYKDDSPNNQLAPGAENKASSFVNGNAFGKYFPITQLGIQTLPGVEFFLNDGLDPIIVGYTGIYELELNNSTQINRITFGAKSMEEINSNPNTYLIVDILYDEEEE